MSTKTETKYNHAESDLSKACGCNVEEAQEKSYEIFKDAVIGDLDSRFSVVAEELQKQLTPRQIAFVAATLGIDRMKETIIQAISEDLLGGSKE